jgi:methyl-accepting chemotaxis protein
LLCADVITSFEHLFKEFNNLLTVEETLKSRSMSVLNFSEQISILSLNVNIKSYFAQEAGRTISVVAKTIKIKTEEIESYTQSIVKLSKDISTHTQRLGFFTSTPRLQTAMINAFIQELLTQAQKTTISLDEMKEIKSNIVTLIDLFMNSFSHLKELLVPIGGKINDILALINSINSSINELERCNFLGNIEAAVIGDKGLNFIYTFNEVKESSETTRQSLLEFKRYLLGTNETTKAISQTHSKILTFVESINATVEKLKTE